MNDGITCTCKFRGAELSIDTTGCAVHKKSMYPCSLCDCMNYRPKRAPVKLLNGYTSWPACTCGHIAQEHN